MPTIRSRSYIQDVKVRGNKVAISLWKDFAESAVLRLSDGYADLTLLGTGTPDETKFLRGDGTWAVPAGGTDFDEVDANTVFAGPTTGPDAEPAFRTLVAADIPSLSSSYLSLSGGTMAGIISSATTLSLRSTAADGASAVAGYIDTSTAWANAGAKLFSFRNNTVEKAFVRHDGGLTMMRVESALRIPVDNSGSAPFTIYSAGGITLYATSYQVHHIIEDRWYLLGATTKLGWAPDDNALTASVPDTSLVRYAAGKIQLEGTTPMLALGGTSSSFPAWKRGGAAIHARLADDSAYTNIVVADGVATAGNKGVEFANGYGLVGWTRGIILCGNSGDGVYVDGSNAGIKVVAAGNRLTFIGYTGETGGHYGLGMRSVGLITWSNSSTDAYDTKDLGLTRNAAGVAEVNNGTGGTFRDLRARTFLAENGSASVLGFSFAASPTFGFYFDSFFGTTACGTGGLCAAFASNQEFPFIIGSTGKITWASAVLAAGGSGFAHDLGIGRNAAGVLEINSSATGTLRDMILRNIIGQTGYHEMVEIAEPAAPADTLVRIFAQDAGGGKTKLMARFPSGTSQQIALEP